MTVDGESILSQHKHHDLEILTGQVLDIASELVKDEIVTEFEWTKIRDLEFQEAYREKVSLAKQMPRFTCFKCPDLIRHVRKVDVVFYCPQGANAERSISRIGT
jgi:antiviral helicase SKI2